MQTLTISIIQTNLYWENKAANLQMLHKKIKDRESATEIVILPEMFSTGFSMNPIALAETMDGETMEWMKKIAQEEKIILTGSIIICENENYYNRLIWMLPNGQFGYYDKRHLFGFAKENEHYTAGKKRLIAQVKGWKINLQICYDLRFPVWARQTQNLNKEPEYDILIYVANWPERRSHAWKTLLCARAIENQCYVIGVNRVGNDGNNIYHSGNSLIVDAQGQILYHKADDEDMFTIELQKENLIKTREQLPFLKDADVFSFTQ
ncbi:MAG: amidohydrolase [Ferruginibacter sp.]|nr:amidohydrolase [Ferruginibacter sp.]